MNPAQQLETAEHVYEPRLDPNNPAYDYTLAPPPGYDPAFPGWVHKYALPSTSAIVQSPAAVPLGSISQSQPEFLYEPRLDPGNASYDPTYPAPASHNPAHPGWYANPLFQAPHSTSNEPEFIYDARYDPSNSAYDPTLLRPHGFNPSHPGWLPNPAFVPPVAVAEFLYEPRLDPSNEAYDPAFPIPIGYDPAHPGWYSNPLFVPPKSNTAKMFGSGKLWPEKGLAPYLGIKARITIIFVAPFLLSLALVGYGLWSQAAGAQTQADVVKKQLMRSCQVASQAADAVRTIPTEMKNGVIKGVERSVNGTVHAAVKIFLILLIILEALITFVINTFMNFFACLVQFIIFGSLSLVTQIATKAIDVLNGFLPNIVSGVNDAVDQVTKGFNAGLDGVEDLLKAVNVDANLPTFKSPDLEKMGNSTALIPTAPVDSLNTLNSSIPTLSQLRDLIENQIHKPFMLVAASIRNATTEQVFNTTGLNNSTPRSSSDNVCSKLDTASLDNLSSDILKFTYMTLALLGLLAVIGIGLLIWMERRSWNTLGETAAQSRNEWVQEHPDEVVERRMMPVDRVQGALSNMEHPWVHRAARLMPLVTTPAGRDTTKWLFYFFSNPAPLGLFALFMLGLITAQIQITVVDHVLIPKYQNDTLNPVNGVLNSLQADLNTESAAFAKELNGRIKSFEDAVNTQVFGGFNQALLQINDTTTQVLQVIDTVLDDSFGKTPLAQPIKQFVYCVFANKLVYLQKGITWVDQNVHIDMQLVDDSVLLPEEGLLSDASNSSGGNLLLKILEGYRKVLQGQRWLFLILALLWGSVIGLGIFLAVAQIKRLRKLTADPVVDNDPQFVTDKSFQDEYASQTNLDAAALQSTREKHARLSRMYSQTNRRNRFSTASSISSTHSTTSLLPTSKSRYKLDR